MDRTNFGIAMATMVSFAGGSLIAKLATNRIGDKAAIWDMIGYVPGIILFGLFFFRNTNILRLDKGGIALAMLAGFTGSIGAILFYVLLSKRDASVAVPLTALYPALTAILALIFLKEGLTWIKGAGIILAAVAMWILSL